MRVHYHLTVTAFARNRARGPRACGAGRSKSRYLYQETQKRYTHMLKASFGFREHQRLPLQRCGGCRCHMMPPWMWFLQLFVTIGTAAYLAGEPPCSFGQEQGQTLWLLSFVCTRNMLKLRWISDEALLLSLLDA
jgi:hypothetical protein